MLPLELVAIFEMYREDDYDLCITKVDYSTEDLTIEFSLEIHSEKVKHGNSQLWKITAVDPRKNDLSFDFEDSIVIKEEHPLLWEFHDIQCELYYSGQCKDFQKLFYDLYTTHKSLFGDYECFNITTREISLHFGPLSFANGLLAKGPKELMLEYGSCLRKNGLDFTIIGERPAKYWNGAEFLVENDKLKILFFGKGYIVAKDFSFARQDEDRKTNA